MKPILEVKGISRIYRNGRGLKDTSFSLMGGEILGLIGANGSGKTTLLKIAGGLTRPDTGRVLINGFDLAESPAKALSGVGALIETPALYTHLTARDNLKIAGMYQGADIKPERMLEVFGLERYAREHVKKFSLGMKQRLALAIAFMGNKKLLLLDEPTNGLDIESAVNVKNAIKTACQETGAAAILSSHLSQDMERLATRIMILKNGFAVHHASIQETLRDVQSLEDFYLSKIREENA